MEDSGGPRRAGIIAVGTELLVGGRLESNSLFLADQLARCGYAIGQKVVVGDFSHDIRMAVRAALNTVDVMLITGGLGSTVDDCTREAIAAVSRRRLVRRKAAYDDIRARYEWLGRTVTPLVARQAYLPVGATLLRNPVGTAAGFGLCEKDTWIFALPGVSREARAMMETQVVPFLLKKRRPYSRFLTHSFNTFGYPETEIQGLLNGVLNSEFDGKKVEYGILASPMGVKVTVSCWVSTQKLTTSAQRKREKEWETVVERVRTCLGGAIFGEGEQTIEQLVGEQLTQRSLTIGLAESCTGGLTTHRLTHIPGSSRYVDRGIVTYSNGAKQELLGVPLRLLRQCGAVSGPVAKAMAQGIRKRSQVDLGVSITGIAGPGGGTKDKPVGLVFMAIDGPWGSQTQRYQFLGDRQEVQVRASQAALHLIRRYLLQHGKA